MSSRLAINNMTVLIELSWQFMAASDVKQNSKKKGGIAIKGSSALQFSQGDGENKIAVLPAWAASHVKNGIVILPLPDQRCWVCGILAGLVAPDTDRVVPYADLSMVLEMLEDTVPDERYLIQYKQITLSKGNHVSFADLDIPPHLQQAHVLKFDTVKQGQRITGFKKNIQDNFQKFLLSSLSIAILCTSGYFGYDWWVKQKAVVQNVDRAIEIRRSVLIEQQLADKEANKYRDTHQSKNMYQAVRNVLRDFLLHDSGWDLQNIIINESVVANYTRKHGFLDAFLKGKKNVTWSQDGGSAILTRSIDDDIPIPMHAYNLQTMTKIQAISLMQQISEAGLQAGLLTAAPKWSEFASKYSSSSGVDYIYWKISVPFSHLQSAMTLLDHPNIAVAEISLNIEEKTCFVEGLIYVSNS